MLADEKKQFESWLRTEPIRVQWHGFHGDIQSMSKYGWAIEVSSTETEVKVEARLWPFTLSGSRPYDSNAGYFQMYNRDIYLELT